MLDFAVPIIDDALGHSVIYEEYKGDYALARYVADENLNAARRANDSARLADALLACGVIHLLQGEPPGALACFREIERLVPNDPSRRLRAASYANLATYVHYNFFPDGGAAGGSEIMARWSQAARTSADDPNPQELLQQVRDPALQLEHSLVSGLLTNILSSRIFVDSHNAAMQSEGQRQQMFNMALEIPVSFRQSAQTAGASPHLFAYADLMTADILRRAQQNAPAQQTFANACSIYQQIGDAAGVGTCQMFRGDWLCAPSSSPNVWNEIIKNTGFDSGPTVPDGPGTSQQSASSAQAAYAEAERLFASAGAGRGLAAIQLRYGYLAMLAGDYASASDRARRALDGFERAGDLLGAYTARAHLALCSVGQGRASQDAIETAAQIGAWGASEGSFSFVLGLGIFFTRVGRRWLIAGGDYERAIDCFKLAEALFRQLGASDNLVESLMQRGGVYQLIGEWATALEAYEQAWDLYSQRNKQRPATELAEINNGYMLLTSVYQIYLAQRDPDGIERSATRLEAITNQPFGAGDFRTNAALQLLSNDISSKLEQTRVLVPLYRAVRASYSGNDEEANCQFESALAAAQAGGDLFLEATVLAQWHKDAEAIEAYHRYRAQRPALSGLGDMLTNLLAGSFGDAGKALARLGQEHIHQEDASFYTRTRDYTDAKTELDTLERMSGPRWWEGNERPWEALGEYGEVYEGLDQLPKALEYYDQAIAELETRRTSLSRDELKSALASGSGVKYIYFMAARTAMKLHDNARHANDIAEARRWAGKAFNYAEQGKARALLDLMAGSAILAQSSPGMSRNVYLWRQINAQLTTWRGLLAGERAQDKPNTDQISYFNQQISENEAHLGQVEAELAVTDPGFHIVISPQAQLLSLDGVTATLSSDTTLLQYYFLDDGLLAWAITSDATYTHSASLDTQALSRQVRDFHRACSSGAMVDGLGSQLAETLLNPFSQVIRDKTHLIIVPYGAAHALPFHALPWEGRPLVATRSLSYLPSASALKYLSEPAGKIADRILAVGDPANMAYQPPAGGTPVPQRPLPAAKAEAASVTERFKPQGVSLLGGEATEEAVRERVSAYPLLHFATHGLLSEDAPMLSSILLANGDAITVYELMGLHLDADVVVLSACRTALGEITGGDDVLGLTRGLLAAGARAAVVTLWAVNDVSTSLLMGDFYRRLRTGEAPHAALQGAQNYLRGLTPDEIAEAQAQLEKTLRDGGVGRDVIAGLEHAEAARDTRQTGRPGRQSRDYSHPYYWAPFVLVG